SRKVSTSPSTQGEVAAVQVLDAATGALAPPPPMALKNVMVVRSPPIGVVVAVLSPRVIAAVFQESYRVQCPVPGMTGKGPPVVAFARPGLKGIESILVNVLSVRLIKIR